VGSERGKTTLTLAALAALYAVGAWIFSSATAGSRDSSAASRAVVDWAARASSFLFATAIVLAVLGVVLRVSWFRGGRER
jgi:hypothetical protein